MKSKVKVRAGNGDGDTHRALAEEMIRRGVFRDARGGAGRVAAAIDCLVDAELRASVARLMTQSPGPTEEQFLMRAMFAYRDVVKNMGLVSGGEWSLLHSINSSKELVCVYNKGGVAFESAGDGAKHSSGSRRRK